MIARASLAAGLLATVAALSAPATAQTIPALSAGAAEGGGTSRPAAAGSVPDHMPPPLPILSPDRPIPRRDAAAAGMATRWRQRSCGTRMAADGYLEFIQGACEPTVVCAPLKICVVALEPGETITDRPDVSDPRWITHPRISGTGQQRTIHIVVKPADTGLDGNMVVSTDRRVVSVRLMSHSQTYMPHVRLTDPGRASDEAWSSVIAQGTRATVQAQTSACDGQPVVPPSGFRIGRGDYAWRPTQVYTVSSNAGPKTCIEFSADISSIDIPVLLALDSSGAEQVVNYRQIGRRLVVDRVLDRAMLVAGVGGSQDSISIDRRGAR